MQSLAKLWVQEGHCTWRHHGKAGDVGRISLPQGGGQAGHAFPPMDELLQPLTDAPLWIVPGDDWHQQPELKNGPLGLFQAEKTSDLPA